MKTGKLPPVAAVRQAAAIQRINQPTKVLVDNRAHVLAQRRLQRQISRSVQQQKRGFAATPGARARTIQRKPLKELDKDFIKAQLQQDAAGQNALSELNECLIYEVDSYSFLGKPQQAHAFTLPYGEKPVIVFNKSQHKTQEQAVLTLFHEAQHARDPQNPPLSADEESALVQENQNEARVWAMENNYAIAKRGEYVKDLRGRGILYNENTKTYSLDESKLQAIRNGMMYKSGGATRAQRYDIKNYELVNQKDISGGWK